MSVHEAIVKIREFMGEEVVAVLCRDYGSHYAIYVGPPGSDPSKRVFVGSAPLVVEKATGKVSYYEDSGLQGKDWEPVKIL